MMALFLAWQVAAAMPHLELGDFAAARPYLDTACSNKNENGCYLLGRTLLALDLYERALQVLAPLALTDPDPARVHDALGSVYEGLRRPGEAEAHLLTAVKLSGTRKPEAGYHLGRFLLREGRTEEAIRVLAPAAAAFPRYEAIGFELGPRVLSDAAIDGRPP